MAGKINAPYGSWKSPITTDLIANAGIGLGGIELDGDDIYWLESRPKENGRTVLARYTPDGKITHDVPMPFNIRSRVHEYGGGAYTAHEGVAYFVNFADQCIYRLMPGGEPEALTPESKRRYADLHVDARRGLLYCVVEDHSQEGQEAENYLAAIELQTGEIAFVLEEGNDFYAAIAVNPAGDKMAWLTWDHPNMPWDGCELWLADLDARGRTIHRQQIAGGIEESIVQPQWSPGGELFFISDRSGWWNLYQWKHGDTRQLVDVEADFCYPQWSFRMSYYGFASANTAYCLYTQDGLWYLGMVDVESGKLTQVQTSLTEMHNLRADDNKVVLSGGSPTEFSGIHCYHLFEERWETLKSSSSIEIDPGYISLVQPVEFPTANDLTAHGLLYLPVNKDHEGMEDEKPPLIVISHGGPTAATGSSLSLNIQFWTSRGYAVFDVNYGGSSGYGREYRTRLNGQWGVVDLQDCENGARYLADQELVDGERLIIRGGSAGGYTTMCAITFGNTFKAGGSYFGLADLEIFVHETHKFESRYLGSLIGPFPEAKELYIERSPFHHAHQISTPAIFFQGLDDKVVPPNQSEMMFEAVRSRELPTAYLAFEGEGHGFRKAENQKRALDAEQYFYSKVFGFEIADEVEPFEIENL